MIGDDFRCKKIKITTVWSFRIPSVRVLYVQIMSYLLKNNSLQNIEIAHTLVVLIIYRILQE